MNYKDLDVYKLSVRLAIDAYSISKTFPKSDTFGLTSQLRRATVSIPCNIAEGAARNSPTELIQFIGIARGSCAEVEALIEIGQGVGILAQDTILTGQVSRISQMLTALSKSLRTKSGNRPA